MNILFIVMLLVFFGYVAFIWKKYGVLASISDSYYRLPESTNFLFTLFCWGFAYPAIMLGNEFTDSMYMFIAGAGICLVGTATQFKDRTTKILHYLGAAFGVIFTQISIAVDFKMYYINAIFILFSLTILLSKAKNRTWWIELIAFSSICYVLGSQLIK